MSEHKKLIIIDGKSVFYRGHFAMPNLANAQGQPTGALHGFTMMALRLIKEQQPDYVIVAWDKSKTNIRLRTKLYPAYKAHRKPMPEEMRQQIPIMHRLCMAFGWPFLEIDDYEADDIMGTLREQAMPTGRQARDQKLDVLLVTSDLDALQLVNAHTKVLVLKQGITKTVLYDEARLLADYGMTPEQFTDYKALRGDPSDNIPGVAGIGEKTAKQLISDYGSLDGVYEHLDDIKGAVKAKLEADRDMAVLSRELVRIHCDVPVNLDLKAADGHDRNPVAIQELFAELGFRRLLAELPPDNTSQQLESSPQIADIKPVKITKTNDSQELETALVFTLDKWVLVTANGKSGYLLPIEKLKVAKLIGFDTKQDLKKLPQATIAFDVMIAAFLLNPLQRTSTTAELFSREFGGQIEEPGRIDDIDEQAAGQILGALWQLYEHLRDALAAEPKLAAVAERFEWLLLPVLSHMEQTGIKLDVDYLAAMSADFAERLKIVEAKIYEQAGPEFNINSPVQLQSILFEKLNLASGNIKKTKSGYSTGAAELAKLRPLHPIIDFISHYRELAKLKNTYIDALPKLVDSDNRLHTTFSQTVAQTGRLSSLHPNLQNIPVRSDEGRAIRRAFVAGPGNLLVSADYSQFELRLAAALAGETEMIEAFNNGADIHRQTAAAMYGIEPEEVSKQQRYSAKTVNFGILYGQGPHGLSQGTGMDMKQAREFIDKYFEIRPHIKQYIDQLRLQAKEQGYVETLFGRRRPTPDVHSSNFAVREAAYRAAVNMPLQGTAADLMKLAMIEIDRELRSISATRNTQHATRQKPEMLLQIHDSILVECPAAQADRVGELLKSTMENIHKLPVKLQVDISTGSNWSEL